MTETIIHCDRRARRLAVGLGVAIALSAAATACGDDDDTTTTTTTTSDGGASTVGDVLPPIVVDLASAEGTTIDVRLGGVVDLTVGDDAVTDWTAEVADPAVVYFTPGRDDGSATFNPGLTATGVGSTAVTMTNSSTGATVTFTVDVTTG